MQPLELSRRIRLDHVEDPEQNEPGERPRPSDRNERQRDQHADDLVHDDGAGIDAAEITFRSGARPESGREQDENQPDFDHRRLRPPDEHIKQETCRGPNRSRRDREIAAVSDRGDEHSEASHALTTRVSASRSWSARLSAARRAGRNPSPAGRAEARYAVARTTE